MEETMTVSFKIKEDEVPWGKIEVCKIVEYTESEDLDTLYPIMNKTASDLSRDNGNREVRWQFDNYEQGHYVRHDYLKPAEY